MQIGREILYLSRADVERVGLSMRETIDILERAHTCKGEGRVCMPDKPVLGNPETGFCAAYVAEIAEMGCQGVKWLSGDPGNPARGLPPITGLIVLNDPATRMPVAILDCTWVTGLRTAGVSGIALRHLANPDSAEVAVLGCGLQGRTNLDAAVSELKNLKSVRAWSPRPETRQRYVREMSARYPQLSIVDAPTAESAVRGADVLLSSTPFGPYGSFQVVEKDWLKPGLTAVPVSQDAHLLPDALGAFDKYYIDDRCMFSRMRCSGRIPRPAWELSEFLTGRVPGRENPQERILLLTEGIAINDMPVAQRVYALALEQQIGMMLRL